MSRFLLLLVGLAATSSLPARELKLRHTFACQAKDFFFGPDGKTLASVCDSGEIKLWDTTTGRNTTSLSGHAGEVLSVAFSPDGKMLASASEDKSIKLWNLASGRNIASLPGHGGYVPPLVFSPDSKTLASGGDATIKLWDVAAGKPISTLPTWYPASLAFSLDGKALAAADTSGIKLWDISTGKSTFILKDGHQHYGLLKLVFGPNGKTLAAAGSLDMETIRLWDMVSRKETRTLDGHEPCGVASFAFRSDSRAIISVGLHDKKVKVWDVATGKNTATFAIQPDDFIAEALSPDGKMLALAYRDKTVKLFDVKAAAEEPDFDAVVLIEGKGRDISLLYVVLTERRKVDHDIQNDLVAKYAKACVTGSRGIQVPRDHKGGRETQVQRKCSVLHPARRSPKLGISDWLRSRATPDNSRCQP